MRTGIRSSAILLMCLTVIGSLIAAYLILSHSIYEQARTTEYLQLQADATRLTAVIQARIKALRANTTDWAVWNDTYEFMADRNSQYIKANLSLEALASSPFDAAVYVDLEGKVVYAVAVEPGTHSALAPVPKELLDWIPEASRLIQPLRPRHAVGGLMLLDEKVHLVAAQAIRANALSDEPRGILVLALALDDNEWAAIRDASGLDAHLLNAASEVSPVQTQLLDSPELVPLAIGEESTAKLAAWTVLRGIDESPVAFVRFDVPRPMQAQAHRSVRYGLWLLFGVMLVVGGASLALLEIFVVGPLKQLSRQVSQIHDSHDPSLRLNVTGQEEISRFARLTNEMLEALEQSQQALLESEDTYRHLAQQAQASNRAKTDFVANVSHELRTPLNGILGMLDLAIENEDRSEQRELLGMAQSAGKSLLGIINDILDFSRMEASDIKLRQQVFSLRELIKQVMLLFDIRAREANISLYAEVRESVAEAYRGDPERLKQILINLVGNALKFCVPDGGIVVLVEEVERSVSSADLHIMVIDSGVGISAEKQEIIFEPFTQADSSESRAQGGTGLGLTIARRLVHLMGGDIRVRSKPGLGSVFEFKVCLGVEAGFERAVAREPARFKAAARACGKDAPEQAEQGKILLVEDNLVNQHLFRKLLESRGHKVTVASNGNQALAALKAGSFDLVLMDCQMPVMDGFEATRLIRSQERAGDSRLPIVALTAHAMDDDREKCLSAGMDDYVSKPIDKQQFFLVIEKFLSLAN